VQVGSDSPRRDTKGDCGLGGVEVKKHPEGDDLALSFWESCHGPDEVVALWRCRLDLDWMQVGSKGDLTALTPPTTDIGVQRDPHDPGARSIEPTHDRPSTPGTANASATASSAVAESTPLATTARRQRSLLAA
jgi:hypothetical protein